MTRGAALACLVLVASLAGCATPASDSHLTASGPPPAGSTATEASASLVGTTAAALRADLGKPMLRRIDGPAEVWLYNSPICRLDVIFYPGTAGQPIVSLARPSPQTISSATCVASLEHRRTS